MTELIWDGKHDEKGRKTAPPKIALPFQTVETVNESAADRQRNQDLFASNRPTDWRNRLIWGDKKYVLPSLVDEFAGKIKLIYIDPPFDTGANFFHTAVVPDDPSTDGDQSISFAKQPSMIEQKAYRDTWGQGRDGYVRWFASAVEILRQLMADEACIYVHLDYHVGHYAKLVMDEVFGVENFRNEIIVKRPISKNLQAQFKTITALSWGHDTILWYSKTATTRYRPVYTAMDSQKPEGYWHHFWSNADRPTMRYELLGVTPKTGQWKHSRERAEQAVKNYQQYLKVASHKTLVDYWEENGREFEFIRLSRTGKVENWFPPATEKIADTLWTDVAAYPNEKSYATEKHEDLLERIVESSSESGDLILDCFCGSGTTAAVSERLNRRWIACDLGRFAIHTTRKRLLDIPGVKPFVVQNLGKYERQAWQVAEFGEGAEAATQAYRRFVLDLYHAQPIEGYVWLHGTKSGRMVHVGGVDAPVTGADVTGIATEFRKAVGTGDNAPQRSGVDVLGWDFAFELNETARQEAELAGINLRLIRIPREVLEKKAVDQGDIKFFELAALSVKLNKKARTVTLALTDFMIPLDDVPEDVQKAVTHWEQWIDYWAVDWDNSDDTFHNEWQTYRTRKDKTLARETSHTYAEPGTYRVVVKVIDILGNDTTKLLEVEVK